MKRVKRKAKRSAKRTHPRSTVRFLNIRLRFVEDHLLESRARRYTAGNASAYARYAVVHFKPTKRDRKLLGEQVR